MDHNLQLDVSPDDELSIVQISAWLGLTEAAIRLWTTKGLLKPTRKTGRKFLFRRGDIDRILAENPKLGKPHARPSATLLERDDETALHGAPTTGPYADAVGAVERALL